MTPFGSRIPLTFRAATAVSHYDFVCLGMRLLLNPPDRPGSLRSGLAGGLSDFLGDPPPDPRFLASLGALSWVDVYHCCVVGLFGVFWTRPKACWWDIGLPGGSSPRPSFSRFARRAVVGRRPSLLCSWLLFGDFWTRPNACWRTRTVE